MEEHFRLQPWVLFNCFIIIVVMLLLMIISIVSQRRWCGSSTWQTPTGRTGTRQTQHHLNRRPQKVSLCLIVAFRQCIWTLFSLVTFVHSRIFTDALQSVPGRWRLHPFLG